MEVKKPTDVIELINDLHFNLDAVLDNFPVYKVKTIDDSCEYFYECSLLFRKCCSKDGDKLVDC